MISCENNKSCWNLLQRKTIKQAAASFLVHLPFDCEKGMSLINWNSPMDRIERRMNQLFNQFYNEFPSPSALTRPFGSDMWGASRGSRDSTTLSPAVDIYETDKAWMIHAELPGVKKEDIKIDVKGDMITISGETKFSQEYTKDNARYQERREGVFTRSLSLPENIDRDKIEAKYENGVLQVQMPKSAEAKPSRKITVQ